MVGVITNASRKSASIVPFQRLLSYRGRGWLGDVGKIKRERKEEEKIARDRGRQTHKFPTGADMNFLHPRVHYGLL